MERRARDIVRDGYNHIAGHYLASKDRDDPVLHACLNRLATLLPAQARVLDLGCGAGVPATQWLAERYRVVGVDLSEHQLALARQHLPHADLVLADMAEIDFLPRSFDAVVSLYAIIHVPRDDQPALVERIARWLKPVASSWQPGR
ncbi:MAG TPA: class I SAM-dependent methyltransferase [Chloroflexota bacterium]|nr:class I SAM-dependent methyltransferase [Chloroflexota bacterium]